MDQLVIEGGHRLDGSVRVSGAKNAALPLMVASILRQGEHVLRNVPRLKDIESMEHILTQLGAEVVRDGTNMTIRSGAHFEHHVSYDLVRRMRASILLLGALLVRCGKVRISLPGGCAIGMRPVDWHLRALRHMGATIDLEEGFIFAQAPRGLKGALHILPYPSVGTTETILMSASMAQGDSVIVNAACEPEIINLVQGLTMMGATIEGAGSPVIHVKGAKTKNNVTNFDVAILPDRIEAGSYAFAVAACGGEVTLTHSDPTMMRWVTRLFEMGGISSSWTKNNHWHIKADKGGLKALPSRMVTSPYPAFPTDLQAQFMVLALVSQGECVMEERVFENRFMHVAELRRMNGDIHLENSHAVRIRGGGLRGAQVMATDLRASMSLVIAGLCASGTTTINRLYHLDRGYEALDEKLNALGAKVSRLTY